MGPFHVPLMPRLRGRVVPELVVRVLQAVRRGEPLEPDRRSEDPPMESLHDGLSLIEGGVARGRKPEGLPDELWPPEEVRERVHLSDRAGRLASRRLLLEWLQGRD